MAALKERERKILEFMKSEIKQKGYPPTVREICSALGIKSTSTVHKDIESLVKNGCIKKDPSKPRALNIIDEEEASVKDSKAMIERTDVIDVPVVGRIAAGAPILAE